MSDIGPEEFLDGIALWQEHKPQTAEDWIAIAGRCVADPSYDITQSSPLFQALVVVVSAASQHTEATQQETGG